jgi:MinD superfamily P-loop ATPase
MLVCFWSAKGGSGTSVMAAATALTLARHAPVRLADIAGDQPAMLALASEPATGVRDWLLTGPQAPADALDRLAVEVTGRLSLVPSGSGDLALALPEAGAALAVALRDDSRPTVIDAGVLANDSAPVVDALVEVADVSLLVVRSCYLALRRAVKLEATTRATGVVVVEESGRSLEARDVGDVLGLPVVATVPVKAAVSRAVDAGVLVSRLPDVLGRPARELARRLDGPGRTRAA